MFGFESDSTLLFLAAAFCALCYLAICARPGKSWLKTVLKTASVALLAVIAFLSADLMLLAAALMACAIGDFFLSRDDDEALLTGVGAFAIGHLAYAVLFFIHPRADFIRLEAGWPLVAALLLVGAVMIVVLFRRAGSLRWAVLFYVPIILLMGIMAIGIPMEGALALILPAALLFIFSDFVLAQEMFVLDDRHRLRRYTPYVVWTSYWSAQAMFLIGLASGV